MALVEAEGLAALTMRRVAEDLGVAPMSLYRHVGDRRGLLLAMLDEVALSVGPVPASTPRVEVLGILTALHLAFRRYPWVVPVLATEGLASRHILPLIDQAFGALFRAGLDAGAVAHAWQMMFHFVAGEALFAVQDGEEAYSQLLVRSVDGAALPSLARVVARADREGVDADLAANLERLVDFVLSKDERK